MNCCNRMGAEFGVVLVASFLEFVLEMADELETLVASYLQDSPGNILGQAADLFLEDSLNQIASFAGHG